jgi:TfoX/Sxy family transcriptional regulator of competence genes
VAYDEHLANRVRECFAGEPTGAVTEQAMFGGLAFLLHGNMSVAVSRRGGLLVRLPPAEAEKALAKPHTEQMVMAGRPAPGWVFVSAEGLRTAKQLSIWVKAGADFARSLPPKAPKRRRPPR